MLKISEAANLAIHAMAYLSSSQGYSYISVNAIASRLDCSPSHLAKVLNQLVRRGMLESSRGAQGGFRLLSTSGITTARQVLEAIDGPFEKKGCLLGDPICEMQACIFSDLYEEIRQQLIDRFDAVKLTDIKLRSSPEWLSDGVKPGDE